MKPEKQRVALSVEMDGDIYDCIQDFLASNPGWNRQLLIDASMSLFLMQNHCQMKKSHYKSCSQIYLNSVCALPDKHFQN